MPQELTPEQRRKHNLLVNDLEYYCEHTLQVQTKDVKDPIQNLKFNKAQKYIHERVEAHKKKFGRVRVIIIKGRQQGASTYITARFYHKAMMQKAVSVYILSHESVATKNLFDKVNLYYELSNPAMQPIIDEDNAKTFSFTSKSKYTIGTAKAAGTGRSGMNHYFHGSESAHYPDGENVQGGALQTVPSGEGTEVFLETTCNGLNWFYDFYKDAKAGLNPYEVIFVPWYWSEEYREKVPLDFMPTEQELKFKEVYGLDNEQLQWRRMKMGELRSRKDVTNPERIFKQEYPFTEEEAFQASGESFFDSIQVDMARKCQITDYDSPIVVGADPARLRDRFTIVARQGRSYIEKLLIPGMDAESAAYLLIKQQKRLRSSKLFIDRGHYGVSIVDCLVRLGYGWYVIGVDFSQKASNPIYGNKRTEIYHECHAWFEDYPANFFDDDEIVTDIMSIPPPTTDPRGIIHLPSKSQIKVKLKRSPDWADACALTHSFPVPRNGGGNIQIQTGGIRTSPSALSTSNIAERLLGSDRQGDYTEDTLRGRQIRADRMRGDRDWG